jgi:arylsulfatase A-like enzyme
VKNLILISLDCVRPDALGVYNPAGPDRTNWRYRLARWFRGGYSHTPNLDAIAEGGLAVEDVFTPAPFTPPAHASIFTGLYPQRHGVRLLMGQRMRADVPTIADVLRARGYQTAAVPAVFILNSETGILRGFDYVDDVEEGFWLERGGHWRDASSVIESFARFLGRRDTSRPFFAFLHFFDAHHEQNLEWTRQLSWAEAYWRRLKWMDRRAVAELLDLLDSLGLTESTGFVLTADHGESLGEHGEEGHGRTLFDSSLKVPLIYALPWLDLSETRFVRKGVSRSIDIAPTVLGLLGFERPEGMRGLDLSDALLDRAPFPKMLAYSETSPIQLYEGDVRAVSPFVGVEKASLRSERWRYIASATGERALYPIGPGGEEPRNVANSHSGLMARFEEKLEDLGTWERPAGAQTPHELDERVARRLKTMGYL